MGAPPAFSCRSFISSEVSGFSYKIPLAMSAVLFGLSSRIKTYLEIEVKTIGMLEFKTIR